MANKIVDFSIFAVVVINGTHVNMSVPKGDRLNFSPAACSHLVLGDSQAD